MVIKVNNYEEYSEALKNAKEGETIIFNDINNVLVDEPILFSGQAIEQSGSLRVTIPKKDAEFLGIKQGDKIRVWIKKIKE